jgi:uncharacterized protein YjbI with pentapeptide repeats
MSIRHSAPPAGLVSRLYRGALLRALVVAACVLVLLPQTAQADFVGTGTHPWVVVLCNFTNQRLDPAPAQAFQQMYTDAGAGQGQFNFVDWWHDVSFGQLSVSGTIVADGPHADANGWYTVNETRDTWGYQRNRFQKVVDCANAAAPDVDFSRFYGVIAIYPEAIANTTSALPATTGTTTVTLDASSTSPTPSMTTRNFFPTPPFLMTLDNGNPNKEIVNVTAINGNTFTIQRAQDGTSAQTHNVGAEANVFGDYGDATGPSTVGPSPGQNSVTLSTGTVPLATVDLPNENNLTGAQHETGHAFGLAGHDPNIHSRKLSYSTHEYKDATDVMSAFDGTYEDTTLGTPFGGAVLRSQPNDKGPGLDAINLDQEGWIPVLRTDYFDNSQPGQSTITLHALSDPNALGGAGYLEARMPAAVTIEDQAPSDSSGNALPPTNPPTCSGTGYACTTSLYYTVEYREKFGWDSGFPAVPPNLVPTLGSGSAVVLHLKGQDGLGYWVDTTPPVSGASFSNHNGLLYPGDELVDPADNTYVVVDSVDGPGHTATVTLGSRPLNASLAFNPVQVTSADFNDSLTLNAALTVDGVALPNKDVTLGIRTPGCSGGGGTCISSTCDNATDARGFATCTISPLGNPNSGVNFRMDPGQYTIFANFSDPAFNFASTSESFTITPEESQVIYTGPTTGNYYTPLTVSARLIDPGDNTPIPGQTVSFDLGSGDSCTGITDANGNARCQFTPKQTPGSKLLGVAFTSGAPDYNASGLEQPFTLNYPPPTASGVSPLSASVGSGSITLKLDGSNFVAGLAQVDWNGTALTGATYYNNGTAVTSGLADEIDVPVPGTDLSATGPVLITAVNPAPGGGTSNPQVFFVTRAGVSVSASDSATSPSSGTGTATVGGTGAGTSGSVTAMPGEGQGTVAVAEYTTNPETSPPPWSMPVNAYFDVFVPSGTGFNSVTITDCNLGTGNVLYYWTGSAWAAVSGQSYSAGPPACVTTTITPASGPSITQLAGTPFAVVANCSLSGYPKLSNGVYDLEDANLAGCSLVDDDLTSANIGNANLSKVNLSYATLTGANLTEANLSRAVLTGAILSNANLTLTNLKGATGLKPSNLSGVIWNKTTCPDNTNSSQDGGTCLNNLTP